MKNTLLLNRGQWVAVFFFICFAVITYQTFLIARPFLPGFLGAVMLGIFFSPVYEKVLKRVDNPSAASFILTLGIFLLTVIPVVLLGWMAFNEAENLPSTLTQSM
ncbi:MAG TPA: hypothetical protein VK791_04185, partial [bacterium]|nr:hypothetical protein [bacterium]